MKPRKSLVAEPPHASLFIGDKLDEIWLLTSIWFGKMVSICCLGSRFLVQCFMFMIYVALYEPIVLCSVSELTRLRSKTRNYI